MSYVKNNWNEGDVITAEKLNNIENGISEISSSGELTTGNLQDGDILIFQTVDGKIKKMRYTEVEVGIQYVEDNSSISSPEDMPDLVGTEEDLSNLQKLLDLNSTVISREIKATDASTSSIAIVPFIFSAKTIVSEINIYMGRFLIINEPNLDIYIINIVDNKGVIFYPGDNKPTVIGSFSIVVKGFLPVEE